MNLRWSLEALYDSFDSEEFERDFARCEAYILTFQEWVNNNLSSQENAVRKLEEYINMQNEFYDMIGRLRSFAHLTLSVEAKNEKAQRATDKLESKIAELSEYQARFEKWVGELEQLPAISQESEYLEEHEFYLQELQEEYHHLLSEKEEAVIAKMKMTGSSAWNKLQNLLASTLLVEVTIDEKTEELPLSVVRNMAFKKDSDVRRAAYEAELKAYRRIEDASAACLNGIKGEVITLSKMRRYESPLQQTLMHSRMDMKTLEVMLTAIEESLPDFRRYYQRKAELLGHSSGLPFYDLFAPLGKVDMEFTFSEAADFIVENFNSFSKRLGDFARNAFEKQWIDAEPREGKRGGAFCSNLHSIRESRILTNFTGNFKDMITLAHELGHGYHGSRLMGESYLNSHYPMPLAETASIFCETIVKNAAVKKASGEEAFVILENSLVDAGQVIVDIYSRYLFEQELFRRREQGTIPVKELKSMMEAAQKEAYGDALDSTYLHPYMWVNKPHYYYADANYYNFPYAFGLLFAKGLYAVYLQKGEKFVESYDRLLEATGRNKIIDVAKSVGIDVQDITFWRNSLQLIRQDIDKFLQISETR